MSKKAATATKPRVKFTVRPIDTNVFVLTSRVRAELKRAGYSNEECSDFFTEANRTGDLEHALDTIGRWVDLTRSAR